MGCVQKKAVEDNVADPNRDRQGAAPPVARQPSRSSRTKVGSVDSPVGAAGPAAMASPGAKGALTVAVVALNTGLGTDIAAVRSLHSLHPDSVRVRACARSEDVAQKLKRMESVAEVALLTDYNDDHALQLLFRGVHRTFISLPSGGDRVAVFQRILKAAQRCGVQYIVLQSVIEAGQQLTTVGKQYHAIEQLLQSSKIQVCV